jgi:hypothetical protein
MRLCQAAFYMCVSESTFLSRVRDGRYPVGRKEGGLRLWLRDELDRHIENQFDYQREEEESGSSAEDPFLSRFGSVQ